MNLSDILVHHAERFPERPALEFEGRVSSWQSLLEETQASAGALAEAGVGRGDVVAVLLHNSDRFLELMHAISHLGAIFMPLNWRLVGPEIAYILDHAGAKVIVSEPELEEGVAPIQEQPACRRLRIEGDSDPGWLSLDELRAAARPRADAADLAADDVHRLMYTSGTTARPKGVMITYGNLYAKNVSHIVEFGMTAEDVGLACGPLYHVGALDLTTTTLMYLGARTHVLRRFDATAALDAIERHRVSHIWLAPAMINAILGEPGLDRRDLGSVRLIIDGGEKMPLPLIERVLGAFPNAWFADAYGLTETVSGDTFLDKARARDKIGSVGTPVIHCEVRIVDPDDRPLPAGEAGEIVIRGPKVCKGYWRDEEATARAMRGGWFHTGDVGVLDEEGFLFIVDRLKDMILSGGENVASLEVERALYEHEAVVEAAVVGRRDRRWGEVPVAYVVLAQGRGDAKDELRAHCAERLAKFKVPKEFHVVDSLPRNPTGKVLKRDLRERQRVETEKEDPAPETARA
jgi:acyl-CoA synthetase (AMP-forming)/AMP-acid ligase II